ncbi:MAG: hypothetical protein DRJ97_06160 [Thermoprotei archaeon]|nr:MAG: hypothetical protein DRJ97_06160 [Thermoprotei archaeon]
MSTQLAIYEETAAIHELMSHPVRLLIIHAIRRRGGLASWSDIEDEIRRTVGKDLNPNVINFHLTKLIRGGIVKRDDLGNYSLSMTEVGPILRTLLESTLRQIEMKERGAKSD